MPAVRADIVSPPTSVATVELQVTASFVPRVSSVVTRIWLLAVTAVVLTTIELETAFVGSATLPAAADPQTAGDAELEQFEAVLALSKGDNIDPLLSIMGDIATSWAPLKLWNI